MVEVEVVEFVYDYKNDEDELTFESPPSKNRRCGIGMAVKGVILMRRWKKIERHQFKVSENEEEFGVGFL